MKKVKITIPINTIPDQLYNAMRDAIERQANIDDINYSDMEDEEWVFTCEGYVPDSNSVDFIENK
jgi:hypothetical protein